MELAFALLPLQRAFLKPPKLLAIHVFGNFYGLPTPEGSLADPGFRRELFVALEA